MVKGKEKKEEVLRNGINKTQAEQARVAVLVRFLIDELPPAKILRGLFWTKLTGRAGVFDVASGSRAREGNKLGCESFFGDLDFCLQSGLKRSLGLGVLNIQRQQQ